MLGEHCVGMQSESKNISRKPLKFHNINKDMFFNQLDQCEIPHGAPPLSKFLKTRYYLDGKGCSKIMRIKRLQQWFRPYREQAGAQAGRGCLEHITTLRLLIDFAKKKKLKLFIIYVDFAQAYDKVPRAVLFTILKRLGCGATMLLSLVPMYKVTRCLIGTAVIAASVVFMDDTVLMSTTRQGASEKLKLLNTFCNSHGMRVNLSKTKFMVINGDKHDTNDLIEDNLIVKVCDHYIYLGSPFTADGLVSTLMSGLLYGFELGYPPLKALVLSRQRKFFKKMYDDQQRLCSCGAIQTECHVIESCPTTNNVRLHNTIDPSQNSEKILEKKYILFGQEKYERATVLETDIKKEIHMPQSGVFYLVPNSHNLYFQYNLTQDPPKVHIDADIHTPHIFDILLFSVSDERLDDIRMLKFKVKWHNSGMNPEVPEHAQFVEDLCAQISPLLISIIDGIIEEDETKEELKSYLGIEKRLFHELMQQSLMCQFRYKNFQGRQDTLTKIRRYLTNDSCVPLILHGDVGCGKSSLIAKAMERCCEWLNDVPLVVRFVGLTPGSSTMEQVLRSIAEQCCALYGEHPAEAAKSGIRHMCVFLLQVWSKACKARPLVIMIDGVDQVKRYGSTSLEWVPRELPEHVKLIMTVRDDSAQMTQLQSIIEDRACFLKIPAFTVDEAYNKFESILKQHHRSVNKEQRDMVSRSVQECPLPLYVEIVGRMACKWTGSETELPLMSTLTEQINAVFDEVERAYGQVEVTHTLGYLTAAKHGLSDSEMIDILSCDEAVLEKVFVHCTPPVRRSPSLLWVQISKLLQPFFMKKIVSGICLLTWRHEAFCDAAHTRYLNSPDQINLICSALIDYFQGKWANGSKKPVPVYEAGVEEGKDRYVLDQPTKYRSSNMSKMSVSSFSRHNRRKLDELPYQVLQLKGRILEEFVLNFDWVYDKLCGSDTYQVLEDVSLALWNHSNNCELVLLKEILELAAYSLGYDGRQFYSQVYGRLLTFWTDQQKQEIYPIMKKLFDTASHAPVPCLLPLTVCLHEPFQDQNMKLGDGQVYFNSIIRAPHNPHYVVTLSTERGEIAVWNIFTRSPVRTLTGITQPRKLKMIDDYRCLVLCGRELRIYNFDEGLFVMKLREVMNQKMPFFGLHDKEHVVALSRSRMYVNMMNLQNGDCVATFKVCEDRFLNSLMVSENGKICVCGDETQKPSALLVWDLELRKLMYDLRIPHHEFITRLAAITKEGHYVSCVCREVDESAPNFIVVYDLQSGTLFKKWKPGVNIISIAISSAGSCVIVGLEDSKIMAYDLITGNPRWTLKGHTAPPDTIRLDNRGLQCLTYDSLGRDRSIRVWDIHSGNSLAVLTPDQAITSCEISSDGKSVVMALEGRNEIVTFLLCHQSGVDSRSTPKSYGNDTNRGKVFDLSQAGTWPLSGDAEEDLLWS
ncbi:unnamed protein product, partial [Meganyctiphanes norvegica]